MREYSTDGLRWWQFDHLAALGETITHGVFARVGGVSAAPYAGLNAGLSTGDDPAAVAANRRRIVAALPGQPALITAHPVHGHAIVEIAADHGTPDRAGTFALPARADAMITQTRGLGLFWAYADCVPILIADPIHAAVALVHAGWRGTSEAVAPAALAAMRERFGTRPAEVVVGLGPTIGPCCYEVDAPVVAAFAAHPLARDHAAFTTVRVATDDGRERDSLRLDLMAANDGQLRAAGVPAAQIEQCDLCTGCRTDLFYSHRMERGLTGRHAVVVGLR